MDKYIIIISSMLLCVGGVLVCLEYPSKHHKLHQGLDYMVYLQYCIDFDGITVLQ